MEEEKKRNNLGQDLIRRLQILKNELYLGKLVAVVSIVTAIVLFPVKCEATGEVNLQDFREMVQLSS